MNRPTALITQESYHVYNRGAHKNAIFLDAEDHERFLLLLYLSNSREPVNLRDLKEKHKGLTFVLLRELKTVGQDLVDVFAYSLLPNHFHIVMRQKVDGGVARFMQKLCTGYSMYFNLRHGHSGTLFQGRFKSSHVDTDPYHKWLFAYVHLNPVSIFEPNWSKEKGIENVGRAQEFINSYRYSSYWDYYVGERPERTILAYAETADMLDKKEDLIGLISESKKGAPLYEDFESGEKGKEA